MSALPQRNESSQSVFRGAVAVDTGIGQAGVQSVLIQRALEGELAGFVAAGVVVRHSAGEESPAEKGTDDQPHFCARLHVWQHIPDGGKLQ